MHIDLATTSAAAATATTHLMTPLKTITSSTPADSTAQPSFDSTLSTKKLTGRSCHLLPVATFFGDELNFR